MELSFDDLFFLSGANLKRKQVDTTSSRAKVVIPILVEKELADDQGYLSPKGMAAVEALIPLIDDMTHGVPLNKRIRNEAKFAVQKDSSSMGWVYGEYAKQTYCTNSEIIIIGKPVKAMDASQGLSSTRQSVASTLKKHLAPGKPLDWLEMVPYAFQLDKETGSQLIWLVAKKKQNIRMAIQAKYFDYLMERFSTVTFHFNEKREEKYSPIQARVLNRGWKGVVALLMPVEVNDFPIPIEV